MDKIKIFLLIEKNMDSPREYCWPFHNSDVNMYKGMFYDIYMCTI